MKTNNLDITELTPKIQKRDRIYAKLMGILKIVYIVFIVLYTLIILFEYFTGVPQDTILGNLLYLLGFSSILVYLFTYHKKLKYANYALPTLHMLKDFVKRYRLFPPAVWWVILGVILILTGAYLRNTGSIYPYVISLIIGFVIGFIIYWRKDKPLVDSAKQLIKELEEV